ncbi:hypothetical protein B0H10DRAFT_2224787 [Mycena sp. CBHHK59/15]|nr:hypothetical protein B0H10DRAFT_2224787 [Mycena sp. CBHHK59/15]
MSLNNWTQLNSEFQFIAENDEHADIAAGDRVIDESLVNEVLDHLESSAGTPEAETQSSEVITDSELHKQLVSVKAQLDAEITQSKKGIPLCYEHGDFFDRPPHPVLLLPRSLEEVKDMFEGIQQGLKDSGNLPTQILYTDSPQAEREFHESLVASLNENVVLVTDWTDLPPFQLTPGIQTFFVSDSMEMEAAAHEILQDFGHPTQSQLYLVALAINAEHCPGEPPRLHIIQFRTQNKVYVFKVSSLTSPSDVLPSLRAILTNTSIIKIGHDIRQTLRTISQACSLPEIEKAVNSNNPPILDIGKYAKLKGLVDTPAASFHDLAGIVLQKCFIIPNSSPSPWSSPAREFLFAEIDCLWKIFTSLSDCDSVGLPLQPIQAKSHGQLVTLVQACKPIAEDSIIGHHDGYLDVTMDDEGHTKRINVSSSRSLIKLSKVLVPGAIHSLHKQTIEWMGETAPTPVVAPEPAFAVPAPVIPSDTKAEFSLSDPHTIALEHWSGGMGTDFEHGEDKVDFDFDEAEFEDLLGQIPSTAQPDSSIESIIEGVDQTWSILQEAVGSETLPTRILDDTFHFMDRLLRLLSKKHSAFKAFAHDFSEAIFIRDKSDEAAVRTVLEKHGVRWEYAKRAMAPALNRRIRCYIPGRKVLLGRVEKLFVAYADMCCTTKKNRGSFFSEEAKEMAKNLLETIRKGYLSDPPRVRLYWLMGKDRDGLNIYRTVRGTNSIEGGFHMTVRRIFGSLRASPELAECLLVNWILRRNTKVGFHNRTGMKYRGHFDLWMRDEIVELATTAGMKPSFPLPQLLSTRIATSETIGILPISKSVAANLNITTLPRPRITGLPHHHDTPVHTLTRLSTKPINPYRYLQMRQLALFPVVPVHTHKEYIMFKEHINNPMFRKGGRPSPPHEHYKNIDFVKFTQFWNIQANIQSPAITDSNQQRYYKIPLQLEAHHKKSILLTSERSTLATGSNFIARKQFLDTANLILCIEAPNDPGSFDRMAVPPAVGEPRDSQFNELEFDNAPPPPPITFHNTSHPIHHQPPVPNPRNLSSQTPLSLSSRIPHQCSRRCSKQGTTGRHYCRVRLSPPPVPPNVRVDVARDAVNTTA